MKLIDTHCHLNLADFKDDYREVIARCQGKDIGINNVGCDYASSVRAVEIADEYQSAKVWASVGRHPNDTDEDFNYGKFRALAQSSPKVIAIGETGLDYYRLPKDGDHAALIKKQKEVFLGHIELAHELSLPLIIHCREAHDDLIEILLHRFTTSSAHGEHLVAEHGVMHCFTGDLREAQGYLDLGFLISFTGIVTFAAQYDEVIQMVPLEKILIETDSPYLTPVPFRGKRNEATYVEYVARRIADIKNLTYEEVAATTTANAQRLFSV